MNAPFSPDSSIRAVFPAPGNGRLIMSGFPGLETTAGGAAAILPESMEVTLGEMRRHGADRLVVMAEAEELPEGAHELLSGTARAHGIAPIFAPIQDFGAPNEGFMADWAKLSPALHAHLGGDGCIALCCQYGAGRSGLVAALLLIERGMAPDAAIAFVRTHFDEAVESDAQVAWLTALAPMQRQGS